MAVEAVADLISESINIKPTIRPKFVERNKVDIHNENGRKTMDESKWGNDYCETMINQSFTFRKV